MSESTSVKLFGRQRSIHEVLGGGTVANVLLWRKKQTTAALLIGVAIIWFLVEIVEYNFVSLLCQILITTMVLVFIMSTVFKWDPIKDHKNIVDETKFIEAASIFHARLNQFLSNMIYVACGEDLPLFLLTLVSLGILSVMGNYFSFPNILFVGTLCWGTLPFLYERYEEEVDHHARIMHEQIKKTFSEIDLSFLNKIPRGPVNEKKIK